MSDELSRELFDLQLELELFYKARLTLGQDWFDSWAPMITEIERRVECLACMQELERCY